MMARKSSLPVTPPRPERLRQVPRAYGWLDARLLREDWLSRLGAEGAAALVFLALAANRDGVSYYGRERMARHLALERATLDRLLRRLLDLDLVAYRPWSATNPDGVWQVLAMPEPGGAAARRPSSGADLAGVLKRIVKPP